MHPMSGHADVSQYVGRVSRYAHSTVHADAGRRLRTHAGNACLRHLVIPLEQI
jgi:hypothetical protein